jgi:hypothetical protein
LLLAFFRASRLTAYSCGFFTLEQLMSCAIGVGHPATNSTVFRLLSVFPAAL